MNTTSTAIAVGLAVVVIAVIFIFPGLSPFNLSGQPSATATATEQATLPGQAATATDASTNSTTQTPMQTPDTTQLQITDETVGTGTVAGPGDSVTVNYVGMLTNGQVFDASANHGQPFTFTLGVGQVIPGWDQGLVGMKVGGKRKLVIPPSLGYGASGAGNVIPPNATLVFEVELVGVTSPAK